MGAFGLDSTATATDNRVAATGNAQVVGKSGTLVNPGSVSVGPHGEYGYNIKGNKGPVVFQSLDQQVVADSLDKLSSLAAGYTESVQKLTNSTISQTNDLVGNVLTELNALATSQQTGGQSSRDSKIIILALGALAVLGIVLWKK
jgi:hypothetical protein